MSGQTQSLDQRQTFRCAVADTRQRCEVRVGAEVLSATLLDESAGGFAVLVDRLTGLHVGQTAELRTDAGWFLVRVVHAAEVEPPKDDGAAVDTQTLWFRVGLSRLGEAGLLEEPTVSRWAGGLHFRLSQWYSSRGMPMAVNALLAAAVVAVPLGLMIALWHSGQGRSKQSAQANGSIWPSGAPHIALLPPVVQPATDASPRSAGATEPRGSSSAFGPGNGRGQEWARSSAMPRQELEKMMRRLPGATAFTLPEVVKRLQLTDGQQREIRRLIDAAAQAIRNLDKQLPGQQRQEVSQLREHLLDEALREALGVLTSQQRAQWEKLSGARPSPLQGP